MNGTLNSIYFTKNGTIPEVAIQNLKRMALESRGSGYAIVFWTDISLLNEETKRTLINSGVTIRDYHEVNPPLLSMTAEFVAKGHAGDVAAYALASDLLRVAIAEITPNDQIFIYEDCNDINFLNLAEDLSTLSSNFSRNPWGFSYPVVLQDDFLDPSQKIALHRNDRMIVRKGNNEAFFQAFLQKYIAQAQKEIPNYRATEDDLKRKQQIDRTSVFCTLFNVTTSGFVFMADNSKERVNVKLVDFASYIESERKVEEGNRWRGEGHHDTSDLELLATLPGGFNPRMFSKSSGSVTNKKIILSEPLNINVEEIANNFPEYFFRKPFESFTGKMVNSALIREQGGVGKRRCIFQFDGKTDRGFTEIHTDLSPSEISEHISRLPPELSTPLSNALKAAGFDLPNSAGLKPS